MAKVGNMWQAGANTGAPTRRPLARTRQSGHASTIATGTPTIIFASSAVPDSATSTNRCTGWSSVTGENDQDACLASLRRTANLWDAGDHPVKKIGPRRNLNPRSESQSCYEVVEMKRVRLISEEGWPRLQRQGRSRVSSRRAAGDEVT